MRTVWFVGCSVVSLLTTLSLAVACPPDSVQVGTVCVDQYSAMR